MSINVQHLETLLQQMRQGGLFGDRFTCETDREGVRLEFSLTQEQFDQVADFCLETGERLEDALQYLVTSRLDEINVFEVLV